MQGSARVRVAAVALFLGAARARAGGVEGVAVEPAEWNYGVRDQQHLITRIIRLRPEAGGQVTIGRVRASCECLRPEVLREEGTADSPAQIKLILDTETFRGPKTWRLYVTLTRPRKVDFFVRVTGWIRWKDGPGGVEVFYAPSEASGGRFLAWWRTVAGSYRGTERVRLLSIENAANYRRLRELERSARLRGPPPEIIAFVDEQIALKGEQEVKAGLVGFLNLESDGRPNPEARRRTPRPERTASKLGAPRAVPPRDETEEKARPRASERARGSAEVASAPPAAPGRSRGPLEMWLFYFSDCRGCRDALAVMKRIGQESRGEVQLAVFDTVRDPESVPLVFAMMDRYPSAPKALPSMVAFVGDEVLLGEDEIASRASVLAEEQLRRGGEHLKVRRPEEGFLAAGRFETLKLLPVVLAGLADGVNPCAFAAMVLLISVLTATHLSRENPDARRGGLLLGGGAFLIGVFVTYYLAGLALFVGVRGLQGFPVAEAVVFWAVWALALLCGVLSAIDAAVYFRTGDPKRVRLRVPEGLRRRFVPLLRGKFSRLGLVLGGLAGGTIIAVLEGVCTGQMYLPAIQYMARTPGLRTRGLVHLLLYNLLFIMPLMVILGVALAGVHFQRLNDFLRRHLGGAKLLLAAVFLVLAAAMILQR